jgi:calcineurin-like phosphoesterase
MRDYLRFEINVNRRASVVGTHTRRTQNDWEALKNGTGNSRIDATHVCKIKSYVL